MTPEEVGQLETDITKGFIACVAQMARLAVIPPAKVFDYAQCPDMVVGHVNPATHEREVLFNGIPVMRTWREVTPRGVQVRCRLIVGDWTEF